LLLVQLKLTSPWQPSKNHFNQQHRNLGSGAAFFCLI
jgi:hypothetical protein